MGTIDLNLLPMFVAVAETHSFSRAGQRLGVPKSTISRGIVALEASLGTRLFHRSTRHVSLSTTGTALYERAADALAALQLSVAEAPDGDAQPAGILRVTAPSDLATTVLAEMIARFAQRYPKIELDLRLSNSMVDLVAEGIDLAVRISSKPLKDSQLAALNLGSALLGLYAAPNYLARRGAVKGADELVAHEWVVFRQTPVVRLEGPNGPISLRPKGAITCDDMVFAREMAASGAGLVVLPEYLAHEHVLAGRLARVLPKHNVHSGNVWLVFPGAKHLPRKVEVFRDFVAAQMKAITSVAP